MSFTWIEDPERKGNCWDYQDENGDLIGYVLDISGRYWVARVWSHRVSEQFPTRDEAELYVAAIVALETAK